MMCKHDETMSVWCDCGVVGMDWVQGYVLLLFVLHEKRMYCAVNLTGGGGWRGDIIYLEPQLLFSCDIELYNSVIIGC